MKIINANAVIIESKAFMALLGYVLEINGLSYTTSVEISSEYDAREYLDQLTNEFLNPKGNLLTGIELVDHNIGDTILGDVEPIHTLNSTMSIARALDLYLAIENAYKYYADQNAENDDYYYCDMPGEPTCNTNWPLFTKNEKTTTLNRVANAASIFYDLNKSDLQDVGTTYLGPTLTLLTFGLGGIYTSIVAAIADNVKIEKTQPGNWSYKQYLGAGYTALGLQTGSGLSHTNEFDVWFNKAFKTTFKVAGTDRTAYFGYQTDDGKEYWAEGQLYFRITLRELIPFIHAVRGNQFWKNYDPSTGVLTNGIYERSDPFFSTWFTNSLNWLAETATPDGRTAPIDDSKKQRLAESSVLRWSSSYGDGTIGNKFAAVNNSLSLSTTTTSEPNSIFEDEISVSTSYGQSTASYGSVVGLRIVELAIPRNSGAGIDFYNPASVFNDYTNPSGSSMSSTSKQSTVIRREINGKKHFILMNGEYGDAISHGEGHEQPDQLQLLYYIDDQSYLMDAGYNNGTISANSSWNHIKYHNLPAYKPNADQTSGGESPPINGWGIDHSVKHSTWDKVARKVAKQDNVVKNYSEKHGNITLLKGEKRLGYFDWQDLHNIEHRLKHFRNVLFIEDPNFPYLIDINTTYRIMEDYDLYEMNYLFKGSKSIENSWNVSTSNGNKTVSFLDAVEFSKNSSNYSQNTILVEESEEDEIATNVKLNSNGVKYFSTVSLIHGNGTVSQTVPQRIFSAGLNHQAWFWSPEQDVVDVVIKRSDRSISSYSNDIDFDVDLGSEIIENLHLSGDLDYGIVRLRKYQNGLWYLEPSYTINMLYNTTQYASNTTITSNESISNTILEIFDNVTLTIEATVNLDDVDVKLGENAKIRVINGGKLIANNGSKFKRLDPAKEHDGVWLETANNEINDSFIQGGYMGLRINGADNLIINQSTIEDNYYGIYAINSDNVHIYGSKIRDNSNDGIFAYYSDIYIDPNTTSNQLRSLFQNNGDNAISSRLSSNIYVYNSEFLDNYKHALYLDQGSRIYLGTTSSDGNNIFDDAGVTRKHIWSYALTGSGETATQWTVPARSNYWDDGDEPSSSNDFFGSVDYFNYLIDPPTSGASKIMAFNPVVSAQIAQKAINEGFSSKQVDNSIELKEFIQDIKEQIDNSDYDIRTGKWIRTYAGMIDVADKELLKEEVKDLLKMKKKWLARYQFVNTMTISDSLDADISEQDKGRLLRTTNDPEVARRISAVQTIGEVMLALEMRQALDNDNYARIFTLVTEYDGRVRSYDLKHELISYMVVASIETQRYALALKLIKRLEAMYPEQDLQDEGWEPEDYTVLKADIEGLKAKGKNDSDDDQFAKAFESEIALDQSTDADEMVSEFKLYPAYPNPFNPSTIVSFDLPEQGKVRVDVYDISGRLVSVLANQNYQPGNHRLIFDASGLASGIYLIRSNIAGNLQTQRITLIK